MTHACLEASWGADPLEYLGGFRSLKYHLDARFHSSLAVGGLVAWSTVQLDQTKSNSDVVEASLTFTFPEIDWAILQSAYGWAALQYQAWARGRLVINAALPQTIVFYTDNVLEFWVDDQPYFGGDFYAYRRAPLVVQLDPGSHKVDLRLIRDVRIMGGVGEPNVQIRLEIRRSSGGLVIATPKPLLPDMIGSRLASRLASVALRNEDREWIDVWTIESTDVSRRFIELSRSTLADNSGRTLSSLRCSKMLL